MNDKPLPGPDAQAQSASAAALAPADFATITSGARRIREALSRVVVGQHEAVDLALVTLLAGGHALIEGVPGVGKTLLVKALARAVAGEFQRIQFTPDLMPADITGTSIFDLKTQEFRLVRGPIFTNFLLADEINRAPAKTQSALLEAMQERQVTIDRSTCVLPPVFVVFATQNPIEHQGTYPLPEAQKDRFLVKIRMGYPAAEEENELARLVAEGDAPERRLAEELRSPVLQPNELDQLRAATERVRTSEAVSSYIVNLVRQTRQHAAVWVGAGPRATLALLSASRALAALEERDFVLPEDVKAMAAPVLEHRILLRPEFEMEGVEIREVINAVLRRWKYPDKPERMSEVAGIITARDAKQRVVGAQDAAVDAEVNPRAKTRPALLATNKFARRLALRPAGTRFSPEFSLPWAMGFLALGACIAPWPPHGWLWFELIVATVALVACYDALALWRTRQEGTAVLLSPEKGLRGREGQSIQVPLALTGFRRRRPGREIRAGIMPATRESESATRMKREPERLKLQELKSTEGESAPKKTPKVQIWPWTPQITLLRRGLWPGPRVGIERRSPLGIWRLRQWFDSPEALRIDADIRPGRREMLRSPVYRLLVASQQTPWTGHGRDFERLREYQPGDNYSEIAWKSTARRAAPVTRLFQWEQKQEVYFVVDQSRASALAVDSPADREGNTSQGRTPRRLLDLAMETALVGATVALELGDEFGLVTYADEPKSWLRAGAGQSQFHQFRERLLNIETLPTTADYDALFGEIRVRLRRRAYLLLLADLTERSVSDSLRRGIGLVSSSHAVLMTSVLPNYARPAFSPAEQLHTEQDVYAALAGEKENQRLGALSRQLRQLNVQLRYVPAETFLRTAVEGYLESKREQRL